MTEIKTEWKDKKLERTNKMLKKNIKRIRELTGKLQDEHNKTVAQLRHYEAQELKTRLDNKQIKKLR